MDRLRDSLASALKCLQAGNASRAEEICRELIPTHPGSAEIWFHLGIVDQARGRPEHALGHYREALRLAPDSTGVRNNMGVVLQNLGRVDEAATRFLEAIQIDPGFPDAHINLGNLLHEQGEFDEASDCYRRAIDLAPRHVQAYHFLGNALRMQGRLDEAIECYNEALRLAPDDARAHLGRSLAWLSRGDFTRGWPEYEWRLSCPEYAIPCFDRPRWDGSPLDGRPILLYADHGMGDAIQFIRYAPLVERLGGRVIVTCRQPLVRILASCPGVSDVIPQGDPLPEFAVHAPLMSLPGILGTTMETIPAETPYLFADGGRVDRRVSEPGAGDGHMIGVAWQGNPDHRQDRWRSFLLDRLEPLARLPGVRLVSLQRGHGTEQLNELRGRFAVLDPGGPEDDLMDTAAIIRHLDLVVAPDTAVAHLAGALGVPVWLALPMAADWRWFTDRQDSPWYPTMRLFRQRRWNEWDEVFARMTAALESRQGAARS